MKKPIKFRRRYHSLPISVEPLVKGQSPDVIKKRQKGCVRVIANGPQRDNGLFNVSLHNQKTGKSISKLMTKSQLTKAIRNDGINPVWVNDDFKFGELVKFEKTS